MCIPTSEQVTVHMDLVPCSPIEFPPDLIFTPESSPGPGEVGGETGAKLTGFSSLCCQVHSPTEGTGRPVKQR